MRIVRNPTHSDQLPSGEWIPAHAVKFNEDGSVSLMAEPAAHNPRRRRRRRNIAAGFYDEEGIFHPIRASYDYSPSRGGDPKRKAKHKAKRKAKRKR